MNFVLSLTWSATEIRKAAHYWETHNDPRNPFEHILVSPLFANPKTLYAIQELKERWNSKVYFDSGGYYVQQGRISYPVLRDKLYEYYMKPENQWADYYVLPDHVPTSNDSELVVQGKVNETCTVAKQFFHQLPTSLQERALPVIQGHTAKQIFTCMETYAHLGTSHVGFGSFGTSGATNSINLMTNTSYRMLFTVRELAAIHQMRVHLFGVGNPPLLYFFKKMGIASFDNISWVRSAGFGNAFLPFMKGFMVSQTAQAMMRSSLDRETFERLKLITNHRCPFCESFLELSSNRWYRIMHNLVCILDTLDFIQHWSQKRILETIQAVSPRYLRYYQEWISV